MLRVEAYRGTLLDLAAKKLLFSFGCAAVAAACLVDTSGLSGGAMDAGPEAATSAPSGVDASLPAEDASIADAEAGGPDLYASTVLADHPLVYYRFDERSGSLAADSSGHGLDATYGSAVTLGAPGLIATGGSAASFDGVTTGGLANFVHRAADPALQLTTAVTAEAWVYPSGSNEGTNLISAGKDDPAPYEPWTLFIYNGIPNAYVVTTDVPGGQSIGGPSALAPTKAYHVAMTYDGAALLVYVDGVVVAQMAVTGTLVGDYSAGLGVGSGAGGARPVFGGILDEVAVYDHALSAATIARHSAAGRVR